VATGGATRARASSVCRSSHSIPALLYSAPALWEYAYARKNNGYDSEPLYKMLHARR
jgi:hypothetical protein